MVEEKPEVSGGAARPPLRRAGVRATVRHMKGRKASVLAPLLASLVMTLGLGAAPTHASELTYFNVSTRAGAPPELTPPEFLLPPDSTWFTLDRDLGVQARLVVTWQGRVVHDEDSDQGVFVYPWSCARLGFHRWAASATDSSGRTLTRFGSFTVPGRCYLRRDFVHRAQINRCINDDDCFTGEFVSRLSCRVPFGPRRGSLIALTWRCYARFNNARRVCEAYYDFSHYTPVRFFVLTKWSYLQAIRRSRLRCRPLF